MNHDQQPSTSKKSKRNNVYPVGLDFFQKYTNVEEYIVKEMERKGPEVYRKNFKIRHRYLPVAYTNFYTSEAKRKKMFYRGLVIKPMPRFLKDKLLMMPNVEANVSIPVPNPKEKPSSISEQSATKRQSKKVSEKSPKNKKLTKHASPRNKITSFFTSLALEERKRKPEPQTEICEPQLKRLRKSVLKSKKNQKTSDQCQKKQHQKKNTTSKSDDSDDPDFVLNVQEAAPYNAGSSPKAKQKHVVEPIKTGKTEVKRSVARKKRNRIYSNDSDDSVIRSEDSPTPNAVVCETLDLVTPKSPLPRRNRSNDFQLHSSSPPINKDKLKVQNQIRNSGSTGELALVRVSGFNSLRFGLVETEIHNWLSKGLENDIEQNTTQMYDKEEFVVMDRLEAIRNHLEEVKKYVKYHLYLEIQRRKYKPPTPNLAQGTSKFNLIYAFLQMTFYDYKTLINAKELLRKAESPGSLLTNLKHQYDAMMAKEKPWPKETHVKLSTLRTFLHSKGIQEPIQLKDIPPRILSFMDVLTNTNLKECTTLSRKRPPGSFRHLLDLCKKKYLKCCERGTWMQGMQFKNARNDTDDTISQSMPMPPLRVVSSEFSGTQTREVGDSLEQTVDMLSLDNPRPVEKSSSQKQTICTDDIESYMEEMFKETQSVLINETLCATAKDVCSNDCKLSLVLSGDLPKQREVDSFQEFEDVVIVESSGAAEQLLNDILQPMQAESVLEKSRNGFITPSPILFQSSGESNAKCSQSQQIERQAPEAVYVSCNHSMTLNEEEGNITALNINQTGEDHDPFKEASEADANVTTLPSPDPSIMVKTEILSQRSSPEEYEISNSVEIIELPPLEPILIEDEESTPELLDMLLSRPSKTTKPPSGDINLTHTSSFNCLENFPVPQRISSRVSFAQSPVAGFRLDATAPNLDSATLRPTKRAEDVVKLGVSETTDFEILDTAAFINLIKAESPDLSEWAERDSVEVVQANQSDEPEQAPSFIPPCEASSYVSIIPQNIPSEIEQSLLKDREASKKVVRPSEKVHHLVEIISTKLSHGPPLLNESEDFRNCLSESKNEPGVTSLCGSSEEVFVSIAPQNIPSSIELTQSGSNKSAMDTINAIDHEACECVNHQCSRNVPGGKCDATSASVCSGSPFNRSLAGSSRQIKEHVVVVGSPNNKTTADSQMVHCCRVQNAAKNDDLNAIQDASGREDAEPNASTVTSTQQSFTTADTEASPKDCRQPDTCFDNEESSISSPQAHDSTPDTSKVNLLKGVTNEDATEASAEDCRQPSTSPDPEQPCASVVETSVGSTNVDVTTTQDNPKQIDSSREVERGRDSTGKAKTTSKQPELMQISNVVSIGEHQFLEAAKADNSKRITSVQLTQNKPHNKPQCAHAATMSTEVTIKNKAPTTSSDIGKLITAASACQSSHEKFYDTIKLEKTELMSVEPSIQQNVVSKNKQKPSRDLREVSPFKNKLKNVRIGRGTYRKKCDSSTHEIHPDSANTQIVVNSSQDEINANLTSNGQYIHPIEDELHNNCANPEISEAILLPEVAYTASQQLEQSTHSENVISPEEVAITDASPNNVCTSLANTQERHVFTDGDVAANVCILPQTDEGTISIELIEATLNDNLDIVELATDRVEESHSAEDTSCTAFDTAGNTNGLLSKTELVASDSQLNQALSSPPHEDIECLKKEAKQSEFSSIEQEVRTPTSPLNADKVVDAVITSKPKTYAFPAILPVGVITNDSTTLNMGQTIINEDDDDVIVPLLVKSRFVKSLPFHILTAEQLHLHWGSSQIVGININFETNLEEHVWNTKTSVPPVKVNDEEGAADATVPIASSTKTPSKEGKVKDINKAVKNRRPGAKLVAKTYKNNAHQSVNLGNRPNSQLSVNAPINSISKTTQPKATLSNVVKIPSHKENKPNTKIKLPKKELNAAPSIKSTSKPTFKVSKRKPAQNNLLKMPQETYFVPQKTHTFRSLPIEGVKKPFPSQTPSTSQVLPTTAEEIDYLIEDASQVIPSSNTASQILGIDCTYFESSKLLQNIAEYCKPTQPQAIITALPQEQPHPRTKPKVNTFNHPTILSDGITARKVWKVHLQWKTETKMTIDTRFITNRHWLSSYDESAKLMFHFSPSTWSHVLRVLKEIDHYEYRRMAAKQRKHCPLITPLHRVLRALFDTAPQVVNVRLINDTHSPYTMCEKATAQYRKPFQCLTKGIPANVLSRMKALKDDLRNNNSDK